MPKIVVADDHVVMREALCELLIKHLNLEVVAQASDGDELISAVSGHSVDLIIMDLFMPRCDGLKALEKFQEVSKCPPILVISGSENVRAIKEALKRGAKGFISKNIQLAELKVAIETVISGREYIPGELMRSLLTESSLHSPLDLLTEREVQVLTHLAEGKPKQVIAKALHISVRTLDSHRTNIMSKLSLETNTDLVRYAITEGLIKL